VIENFTEVNRLFPQTASAGSHSGVVSGNIIRRVKLLGLTSSNGREYPKETVARAASLYEGAKVNVDHPRGSPGTPRGYGDRIGSIRNVHVEPDGLYGDLIANPKHALFEQLAWDARNCPGAVGLSHNIQGRTTRRSDGIVVVEEITRVQSVDLVADPATTRGLFEHGEGNAPALRLSDITGPVLAGSFDIFD